MIFEKKGFFSQFNQYILVKKKNEKKTKKKKKKKGNKILTSRLDFFLGTGNDLSSKGGPRPASQIT